MFTKQSASQQVVAGYSQATPQAPPQFTGAQHELSNAVCLLQGYQNSGELFRAPEKAVTSTALREIPLSDLEISKLLAGSSQGDIEPASPIESTDTNLKSHPQVSATPNESGVRTSEHTCVPDLKFPTLRSQVCSCNMLRSLQTRGSPCPGDADPALVDSGLVDNYSLPSDLLDVQCDEDLEITGDALWQSLLEDLLPKRDLHLKQFFDGFLPDNEVKFCKKTISVTAKASTVYLDDLFWQEQFVQAACEDQLVSKSRKSCKHKGTLERLLSIGDFIREVDINGLLDLINEAKGEQGFTGTPPPSPTCSVQPVAGEKELQLSCRLCADYHRATDIHGCLVSCKRKREEGTDMTVPEASTSKQIRLSNSTSPSSSTSDFSAQISPGGAHSTAVSPQCPRVLGKELSQDDYGSLVYGMLNQVSVACLEREAKSQGFAAILRDSEDIFRDLHSDLQPH